MKEKSKGHGMSTFERDHWEKKMDDSKVGNGKYTQGEMSNPEHLKASVDKLSSYAKKNQMKY